MLLFDRYNLHLYFKMQNALENPDLHAQRQPTKSCQIWGFCHTQGVPGCLPNHTYRYCNKKVGNQVKPQGMTLTSLPYILPLIKTIGKAARPEALFKTMSCCRQGQDYTEIVTSDWYRSFRTSVTSKIPRSIGRCWFPGMIGNETNVTFISLGIKVR